MLAVLGSADLLFVFIHFSVVASWVCALVSSPCLSSTDDRALAEGANWTFLANWLQFVHVLLPSHCSLTSPLIWGDTFGSAALVTACSQHDKGLCVVRSVHFDISLCLFFLFILLLFCLLPSLSLSFPSVLYGGYHGWFGQHVGAPAAHFQSPCVFTCEIFLSPDGCCSWSVAPKSLICIFSVTLLVAFVSSREPFS